MTISKRIKWLLISDTVPLLTWLQPSMKQAWIRQQATCEQSPPDQRVSSTVAAKQSSLIFFHHPLYSIVNVCLQHYQRGRKTHNQADRRKDIDAQTRIQYKLAFTKRVKDQRCTWKWKEIFERYFFTVVVGFDHGSNTPLSTVVTLLTTRLCASPSSSLILVYSLWNIFFISFNA